MEKICDNCNNLLENSFEFCPYCSNPISEKAKKLESDKTINAQLITLANLIREIDDPKALYAIDKMIKALSKK